MVATPFGPFELPGGDPIALGALLAVVPLLVVKPWKASKSPRNFLVACAVSAIALSRLYFTAYLRGGPRIIDAAAYTFQARTFASGAVAFASRAPLAATLGRFVVATPDGRIAGIFPPGWPLVLAIGHRIGLPNLAPLALAGALPLATYAVARKFARGADDAGPRLAALLVVLSAPLRYFGAEPMAHGLCALLILSFFWVLPTSDATEHRVRPLAFSAAAGLAVGTLATTRFASAFAPAVLLGVALLARRTTRTFAEGFAAFAGLALPLALLFGYQYRVTGDAFRPAQSVYYALTDGPVGCFRYGFGRGIGCQFEHGPFVAARLPDGFFASAALGTTARRLALHLGDLGNQEFTGVLTLLAIVAGLRARGRRLLAALPLLHILAYAPFYFDGNYPGGGARLLADVLPIEAILLGLWVVETAPLFRLKGRKAPHQAAYFGAALLVASLVGFAFHGSAGARSLRDRDGGSPQWTAANELQISEFTTQFPQGSTLTLIDGDAAFLLANDPMHPARIVARASAARGGDDRPTWALLGHPPTMLARDNILTNQNFAPLDGRTHFAWSGTALWPLRAVENGYGFPRWDAGSAGLELHRQGAAALVATVTFVDQIRACSTYLVTFWGAEFGTLAVFGPEDDKDFTEDDSRASRDVRRFRGDVRALKPHKTGDFSEISLRVRSTIEHVRLVGISAEPCVTKTHD